jgi:UDP-N-acetylglucosamine 2-epimerase
MSLDPCIVGRRPGVIDMALVIKNLLRQSTWTTSVVHVRGHHQMLDQALKLFGIRSDSDPDVMNHTVFPFKRNKSAAHTMKCR